MAGVPPRHVPSLQFILVIRQDLYSPRSIQFYVKQLFNITPTTHISPLPKQLAGLESELSVDKSVYLAMVFNDLFVKGTFLLTVSSR
jgi:hypothetical protein